MPWPPWNSTSTSTHPTHKSSTATTHVFPPHADAQRKYVNDVHTSGRLEHSQLDDSGDRLRVALPPASSTQWSDRVYQQPNSPLMTQREQSVYGTPPSPLLLGGEEPSVKSHHEQKWGKEKQPRLPINTVMNPLEENSKLETMLPAPLTPQRKPDYAHETLPPPPLLDVERGKDKPSVRSRREQEREKERESGTATNAVMDALKENEKLKTMPRRQTQQPDATRESTKQERSQMLFEAENLRGKLNAAREAHKRDVEYLTAERERVQKDRESIRRNLSAEIEQLKVTQAMQTERLDTGRREMKQERSQMQSEAENLRGELNAARETHRREVDKLKMGLQESLVLKEEYNQLQTLLQDRTAELQVAQSFLTTTDASSGTEVTSALERLNAEVLQNTAFMAESMAELLFHRTTMQVTNTDEQLAACGRASSAIGGAIVHLLGTRKHKEDSILIQIAFQACLTLHLHRIICTWLIGGHGRDNWLIDTIYQSLRGKEAQAIAGRWRALTRAHVPSTLDQEQTALQIRDRIIFDLSDILLSTGCDESKSDIASALSSKFTNELVFLASLAMGVNKIVGEDVTSGDFEVTAVPPATPFDETEMEDSFNSGKSATARGNYIPKVLCTTDLGLRKVTRVGTTGENQWQTRVLLKPKVALESVVDILDE